MSNSPLGCGVIFPLHTIIRYYSTPRPARGPSSSINVTLRALSSHSARISSAGPASKWWGLGRGIRGPTTPGSFSKASVSLPVRTSGTTAHPTHSVPPPTPHQEGLFRPAGGVMRTTHYCELMLTHHDSAISAPTGVRSPRQIVEIATPQMQNSIGGRVLQAASRFPRGPTCGRTAGPDLHLRGTGAKDGLPNKLHDGCTN